MKRKFGFLRLFISLDCSIRKPPLGLTKSKQQSLRFLQQQRR
ncbi:hypothetical protein CsSME_00041720 [Camellia sinensis var. sinensis]